MNKMVKIFLLTVDKFMPEMHFKQPEFTYSVCGAFTKHCERIQKHLYINELGKTLKLLLIMMQHCLAYDSKSLAKITSSDKSLKNRAYEIIRICKYDGYQRALASVVYTPFDKKTELGMSVNEQLAEEIHKPIN